MTKPVAKITLLCLIIALFGCQNKSNSTRADATAADSTASQNADNSADALHNETMALGWHQLQKSTFDNIQQQNYGEAALNIKQMMAFAGESNDQWEFIRMALVSLPKDVAYPLVQQALEKSFIQSTAEEMFAFSRVLTQLQKQDEAILWVNKAIAVEKQEAYVYWRARLYLLTDQEDLAEKDYQWLLMKNPESIEYRNQYATLLNYLKRNEDAIELLAGYEDTDLMFRHIMILLQQDKEAEAEAKFEALKKSIQTAQLTDQQKLDVGELAFWLGDDDFSLSLLQSVQSGDAINQAKLLMSNVLIQQKAYDRALVLFRQVQNGPQEHAIRAYLQELGLHALKQDNETAMKTVNTGLRLFKDDPQLLYARAMLFAQLDDLTSLERDLNKILSQDPENSEALNALGYTWADENVNLEQAYDYIMKAHQLDPDNSAIIDSVGWIHFRQGNLKQAEHYLRLAIEKNPRERESYDHLIEVLEAKGDQQAVEAVKHEIKKMFKEE